VSATVVHAQTNQLNVAGSVNLYQTTLGPTGNLIVDFVPIGGGTGQVQTCCFPADQTGVFAPLGVGTVGTQKDLVLGPTTGTPAPTALPITSFLVIGGFTFNATSFGTGNVPGTPVTLTYDGIQTTASLSVRGTVTGPGLAAGSTFIGGYSTQFPGLTPDQLIAAIEGGAVFNNKSVSGTFTVSSVPEPATLALMGAGLAALVGCGMVRRRTEV
jgi:hypothetical protein